MAGERADPDAGAEGDLLSAVDSPPSAKASRAAASTCRSCGARRRAWGGREGSARSFGRAHGRSVDKRRHPPYISGGVLHLFLEAASRLYRERPPDGYKPPLGHPHHRLLRAADDRARRHDRERRAAGRPAATSASASPASPGSSTASSSPSAACCCSPAGSATSLVASVVPRRPRHLHVRVAPLRARPERGSAASLPACSRARRRRSGVRDPRDDRHRARRRPTARGPWAPTCSVGRGRLARPAGRRPAHRGPELALGLLRQPPDRRGDLRARIGARPLRPRARLRARRRLAGRAARHRLADERHLRDRRGDHVRLGVGTGARHGALAVG